jgi:hypothetical protein
MRRQKCDRQSPCGRCLKRGNPELCTTDWGPGGYDAKKHRVYPRHNEPKDGDNVDATADALLSGITAAATDSSTSNRTPGNNSVLSILNTTPGPFVDPSITTPLYAQNTTDAGSSTIDFPSWGRTSLTDYDVRLKSVSLLDDTREYMP